MLAAGTGIVVEVARQAARAVGIEVFGTVACQREHLETRAGRLARARAMTWLAGGYVATAPAPHNFVVAQLPRRLVRLEPLRDVGDGVCKNHVRDEDATLTIAAMLGDDKFGQQALARRRLLGPDRSVVVSLRKASIEVGDVADVGVFEQRPQDPEVSVLVVARRVVAASQKRVVHDDTLVEDEHQVAAASRRHAPQQRDDLRLVPR